MTQVVCAELQLKAVFCKSMRGSHNPGVIYQQVKMCVFLQKFVCKLFYAVKITQIKVHQFNICKRELLNYSFSRNFTFIKISDGKNHLRTLRGKSLCGLKPYSA
ncbi:hypothetical protein SDC9_172523 [bioreactor metagenome]|uniref:Uncharacterized protein n=1 Tax=bioreactor metagenome TaxID=1076179 RepID=A0A645GG18_9ZZZZ